tara:strand:- start:289 stop:612 length:324 start_codon:yes stop_codon:yes gene_type:complete
MMNNNENIINIYPGDFIYTNKSKYPALVISKDEIGYYLVSIIEYNGDYALTSYENADPINLESLEKLGILAKFGDFFYDQHKELYQEILIEYLTSISQKIKKSKIKK